MHGRCARIEDEAMIARHADKLEVLSVYYGYPDMEYNVFRMSPPTLQAMLRSLIATRHFSCQVDGRIVINQEGILDPLNEQFRASAAVSFHVVVSKEDQYWQPQDVCDMFDTPQTINLVCSGMVQSWTNLDGQSIRQLREHNMFESEIACAVLEGHASDSAPPTDRSLEYLAVTNNFDIDPSRVKGHIQEILLSCLKLVKRVLSLKPNVRRKSAVQIRQEIMKRYEERHYHFLEEYVIGMTEVGCFAVRDWWISTHVASLYR